MSERTARLFEDAQREYDSAEEAWEAAKELREEIDWDSDSVRRE